MAIADAVLQQLVEKTKCKTLFITHYPLVATSLERRFPLQVENLHMSYASDTRIDGTRELTFLYRLVRGIATGERITLQPKLRRLIAVLSESFGIECGRLAGLPEPLLSVALEKAGKMQEEVKQRRLHNLSDLLYPCPNSSDIFTRRVRKACRLLKPAQVQGDAASDPVNALEELRNLARSLQMTRDGY